MQKKKKQITIIIHNSQNNSPRQQPRSMPHEA